LCGVVLWESVYISEIKCKEFIAYEGLVNKNLSICYIQYAILLYE